MSEMTEYQQGIPCWVDLMTPDRQAAMDFYRALFGWDYQVSGEEYGFYTMALLNGKTVAAIMQSDPAQPAPVAWTTYLAVDSADDVAERTKAGNGQIFAGPMDVPEQGKMMVGADPSGAMFGTWQALAHKGAQLVNEPGTVVWNELITRNAPAARKFYADVFGVGISDPMEGMDYTTIQVGGRDVGGIWAVGDEVPADMPAHWRTYFGTRDTDATIATVRVNGGAVLSEPMDTPYGRMAACADPQGGVFSVMSVQAG